MAQWPAQTNRRLPLSALSRSTRQPSITSRTAPAVIVFALALLVGCGPRARTLPPSEEAVLTPDTSYTPTADQTAASFTPQPPAALQAMPTQGPQELTMAEAVAGLPSWLADPSPVLMWGYWNATEDRPGRVSFFQAATGDRYDLPLYGIAYFLWLDNMHAGFLGVLRGTGGRTLTILDLKDGRLAHVDLPSQALAYIQSSREDPASQAYDSTASTYRGSLADISTFLLIDSSLVDSILSADDRFILEPDSVGVELKVQDRASGEMIQLSPSDDGFVHGRAAWSPSESVIADLQEDGEWDWSDPIADRLAIYDAASRSRLAIVDVPILRGENILDPASGLAADIAWSPSGRAILFLSVPPGSMSSGIPCWFSLDEDEVHCLDSVLVANLDHAPARLSWSATGQEIRYLVCDLETGESAIIGYGLDGSPSSRLEDSVLAESPRVWVRYQPSPREEFMLVTHDFVCPKDGFSPPIDPGVAVFDPARGELIHLDVIRHDDPLSINDPYPDENLLWRPLASVTDDP